MVYSSPCSQLGSKLKKGHNLYAVTQGIGVGAGVNHKASRGVEIAASRIKTALGFWAQAAFDLDGPQLVSGQAKQEIDFGTPEPDAAVPQQ